MASIHVDRCTDLRWRLLSASCSSGEEAAAAVRELATSNPAEGWRLPTFDELVQCVNRGESLPFAPAAPGAWCATPAAEASEADSSAPRGLDLRCDTYVAAAQVADLAAVAVAPAPVATRPPPRKQQRLTVLGYLDTATFQKVSEAAEYLNKEYAAEFAISVKKMFAFEFERLRQQMIKDGKIAESHSVIVADEANGSYLDGEAFLSDVVQSTDFRIFDTPDDDPNSYTNLARKNLSDFLRSTGSSFCWMLIKIGDAVQGRIVFQLHSNILPRTCENFIHLCRGDLPDAKAADGQAVKLHYKGSTFYRVVKGGWVQGGDITGRSGNGGHSVYGPSFPDESFNVRHDCAGILGMVNDGEHTNSSNFYITTGPASWMNGKYVAFGRVIEGLSVVEAIHTVQVKHNQSPTVPVTIQDCGFLSLD